VEDSCTADPARRPLLTPDSIGILDIHQLVGYLRAKCPSARDTAWEGEETINHSLVFHFPNVTAVASQVIGAHGDAINPAAAADFWMIRGSEARLPQGLSLASRWAELRAAYGRAVARWESGGLQFCTYPWLQFFLRPHGPKRYEDTEDLSFIPDTAAIEEVWVMRGPIVHSACKGQ